MIRIKVTSEKKGSPLYKSSAAFECEMHGQQVFLNKAKQKAQSYINANDVKDVNQLAPHVFIPTLAPATKSIIVQAYYNGCSMMSIVARRNGSKIRLF